MRPAALGLLVVALSVLGGLAGAGIGRSCLPGPAPGELPADLAGDVADGKAAIEEERKDLEAAAECRLDEIEAEAEAEKAVPIVEWLNGKAAAPARPAVKRSEPRTASGTPPPVVDPGAFQGPSDGSPCLDEGNGWIRCPSGLLDRVRFELVDARAEAASQGVRLGLEREERRLDGLSFDLERKAYRTALGRAGADDAAVPWKIAGGVVGGALVATGVALAASGKEAVGGGTAAAGATLAVVAFAW